MATLQKLLDALGYPKAFGTKLPSISPVIVVAPPPELAYGWSGQSNLIASGQLNGAQGAGTVIAVVTIPNEGFYDIDWNITFAPATINVGRSLNVQIQDVNSQTLWQLNMSFFSLSLAGIASAIVLPTMRAHLPATTKVQVSTGQAMTAGDFAAAGISLRRLYEETF